MQTRASYTDELTSQQLLPVSHIDRGGMVDVVAASLVLVPFAYRRMVTLMLMESILHVLFVAFYKARTAKMKYSML